MERGDHRADHDQRSRGEHQHRRAVGHAADHEQHRAGERLPHLAARPVEVEDAGEEGGEGDETKPDQIPVALLQDRQVEIGPPRPSGRAALPARLARHKACIRRNSAAPSLPWSHMSGRPRVLVVEDDADIAGVLRRSLDKEGYDVRVAGDGEAALEQSGVFEPDAVVLDLELLEHLMRNERIVVSRQALLDEVWGYHPFAETNTVDVFISNLRRKLEAGGEPRVLHTVRGAGYVLRDA